MRRDPVVGDQRRPIPRGDLLQALGGLTSPLRVTVRTTGGELISGTVSGLGPDDATLPFNEKDRPVVSLDRITDLRLEVPRYPGVVTQTPLVPVSVLRREPIGTVGGRAVFREQVLLADGERAYRYESSRSTDPSRADRQVPPEFEFAGDWTGDLQLLLRADGMAALGAFVAERQGEGVEVTLRNGDVLRGRAQPRLTPAGQLVLEPEGSQSELPVVLDPLEVRFVRSPPPAEALANYDALVAGRDDVPDSVKAFLAVELLKIPGIWFGAGDQQVVEVVYPGQGGSVEVRRKSGSAMFLYPS